MILARRILPFIAPAVLVALFSGVIFQPAQWPYWVGAIALTVILSIGFLVSWKFDSQDFWGLLFPVLTLFVGGIGSLFFLNSFLLQILAAIFLIVLFGIYIEDVFVYRFQQHRYSQLSLPNLSFFINTCGAFGLFSFVFALRLIGLMAVWQMTALGLVFGIALVIHLLWSYQVWHPRHASYALLVGLLVAELVWVLQFWPTAFFVNGAIVAVLVYLLPSLIQMHLRDTVTRVSIMRYTIISLATLAFVLGTSQWT